MPERLPAETPSEFYTRRLRLLEESHLQARIELLNTIDQALEDQELTRLECATICEALGRAYNQLGSHA